MLSVFVLIFALIFNGYLCENELNCATATVSRQCPKIKIFNNVREVNFTIPSEKDVAVVRNIAGIIPIHYKWYTNFLNDTTFEGRVKIFIDVAENTNRILLNAYKLEIDPSTISLSRCNSSATICLTSFVFDKGEKSLLLEFQETLVSNQKYVLNFDQYFGSIGYHDEYDEETSAGIWRNDFADDNDDWAIATIFQMRNARSAYPCFDHPSLKATFSICIEHPSDTVVLSNTELENTRSLSHRSVDCFKRTPKIPTYVTTVSLLANFTHIQDSVQHPEIDVFFEDAVESQFHWQLAETRLILHFCQTDLHLNYSLSKLGLLNISPVQFWGVENFGLISMESGNPSNMGNRDELIHRILVHEIIHQWIGNVATISYWDEVCLQEGLTAYLEWMITDRLKLVNTSFDQKLKDTLDDTWNIGRRYIERLVDPIIEKFSRTQSIANYCFNRPPLILHMISYSYGKTLWLDFTTEYVKKFAFSNANLTDWVKLLNRVAGTADAGNVLTSWFTEKGYPIIYARQISPSNIRLRLKSVEGWGEPSIPNKTHLIPLRFRSDIFLSNTVLIGQPAQVVDLSVTLNKWFLVDPDFVVISKKIYAPNNYLALLECVFGPDKESCKVDGYQFEKTFETFCGALRDNLLPWSDENSDVEKDNAEDWKNLLTKLRTVTFNKTLTYLNNCRCAFLTKEDIENRDKDCAVSWNNRWRKSNLMKLLSRTYEISRN